MMRRRQFTDEARAERWKREDEAPRLRELFPELIALRLETDEPHNGRSNGAVRCIRPINVERAGALFEVRCGEPRCDNPGHDITRDVVAGLRNGAVDFSGDDPCNGMVGHSECGRVLHFVVKATWRKEGRL